MLERIAIDFASSAEGGRLSILIFHRVLTDPDPLFPEEMCCRQFERVMSWIASWFNVIALDEAVTHLARGTLPRRAACITFDDGYADNLINALPILNRSGLPATFFIATGFIDGGLMWNDALIESIRGSQADEIDARWLGLGTLVLAGIEDRRNAIQRLIPAVKHLSSSARDDAVARIVETCRAALPSDLMLTTAQLKRMRAAGATIGAHTCDHPILSRLELDDARRQISDSRDELEAILGERVGLFAYPNGKPVEDYLPEHAAFVKSLGFDAAVSTAWGFNSRSTDPYQLKRFTPWARSKTRYGFQMLRNLL